MSDKNFEPIGHKQYLEALTIFVLHCGYWTDTLGRYSEACLKMWQDTDGKPFSE